ncbi:unnamed protein product [Phytomonas sp. EM1]|nr:unnamed protein product [Phytomonas sp. EM1]|eukprot:CCW60776.1 unnamed protein product [Phytomonas sp. isolate EM1]
MQRDTYAGLIKKRHLARIPIRILQLNGRITHENVYEDVFIGYRLRRLVLMTHFGYGRPPPPSSPNFPTMAAISASSSVSSSAFSPIPKDFVVASFEKLAKMHNPGFVYRLVPLLCADIDTFAAMQAICASEGSPFTIEDRRDPVDLTHRFPNGCAQRGIIGEFFKKHISPEEMAEPAASRRLPITGIEFDGLLLTLARERIAGNPPARAEKTPPCEVVDPLAGRVSSDSPLPSSSSSSSSLSGVNHPPDVNEGEVAGQSPPTRHQTLSVGALLTTHGVLNEKVLLQRALVRDFFESPLYWQLKSNTPLIGEVSASPRRMHFIATQRPVGSDSGSGRTALLQMAKEFNLFVYEKVDNELYQFAV